jgi:uncharacterized protein (DUF58 family)
MMAGILAESWSLVALATVALTVLMGALIAFYPKPAAVRRRMLELAWWVPSWELTRGSLTPKSRFPLRIYVRNKAPYGLGWAKIDIVRATPVRVDRQPDAIRIEGRSEMASSATLNVQAAGHWFLHGAVLTLTDGIGFFEMQAYFPIPLELRVFPRLALPTSQVIHSARVGAPHQRTGAHRLRLTGFGGELREIREHRPGDPFKQIAWKPTARRRKLMVKQYESEILMTHHLVVDISSTMRDREPGGSKLDYAIDFAASLSKEALEVGDRVGLTTVDSRPYGQIKAAEGRPQLYRIIDHLMELHHVVDEDLTDVTSMELVESVASYLIFQEGVDPRPSHVPPPDSELWNDIIPGPTGQLYNLRIIDAWASTLLTALDREPSLRPRWLRTTHRRPAGEPRMARLRQICRLRGIEVPYRTGLLPGRKARGLADSLRRIAARGRSHFILVISDLQGLEMDSELRSAIRLARNRFHDVAVVCPFAPHFVSPEGERRKEILHRVFAGDELRQLAPITRQLVGLGVRVDFGGPHRSAGSHWSRVSQARRRRAGLAA